MTKTVEGICALTRESGPFVKSHIVPRAFSKAKIAGQPLIEWRGRLEPPGLRRDGLYDSNLVTRAGEDILQKYDDWAINELRRRNMIWSAWGLRTVVPPPHEDFGAFGIRIFDDIDPRRLRLFFSSVLWRAAASKRREVTQVSIPDKHLILLRESLRSGKPLGDDFYPVTLTQYSTMGELHQANPLARMKQWYDEDGNPTVQIPIFRFFFDGLVVHFHRLDGHPLPNFGISGVGNDARLCLQTIPFHESAQKVDLERQVMGSMLSWPEQSQKLLSTWRAYYLRKSALPPGSLR